MKAFLLSLTLTFTAGIAHAQLFNSAQLSEDGESIEIGVIHGGCSDRYEFSVERNYCRESHPVQCSLRIHTKDNGWGNCPQGLMTQRTLSYTLEELGLEGDYYSNASIQIIAETESPSGRHTQTLEPILLPELSHCAQFEKKVDLLVRFWKTASDEAEKNSYRDLIQDQQRRAGEQGCPIAIEPTMKNSVGKKIRPSTAQ